MAEPSYPNETLRLMHERASVRKFADRKIEPEVMECVLEAGVHAATGGMQPYSVIKIDDTEIKQKILEFDGGAQKQIVNAPVDLVFCVDMRRLSRWAELEVAPFTATHSFEEWWIAFIDTVIFAQSVCTAADAMGLGSVYIGTVYWYFDKLRELLDMPKGVYPVVLVCMGYPEGERPKSKKKLGTDVVVHENRYRELSDEELIARFNWRYGDQIKLTDERLAAIVDVCRGVHGDEFADRCEARLRENGYINMVQYLYGLAYVADKGVEGNENHLRMLEDAGFGWFRRYSSARD